jgi:pimeloyl-ACP methyl ester carboxylesterase
MMAAYRAAARPLGYAPIRRLRLGSDDEQRGYVDQLTGWALSGTWTRARDGFDYRSALPAVTAPVWAVQGDGDRLSGARDAGALLEPLPAGKPLRRARAAVGRALPVHRVIGRAGLQSAGRVDQERVEGPRCPPGAVSLDPRV